MQCITMPCNTGAVELSKPTSVWVAGNTMAGEPLWQEGLTWANSLRGLAHMIGKLKTHISQRILGTNVTNGGPCILP